MENKLDDLIDALMLLADQLDCRIENGVHLVQEEPELDDDESATSGKIGFKAHD